MIPFRAAQMRNFSSTTFRVLAMPRLSPTTESARIKEWYLQKHSVFESYQLALRVETHSLLDDDGDTERKTHELDIEIIEEGSVVRILVEASDELLDVDTPLAILSDDADWNEEEAREVNVHSKNTPVALWQAYAVEVDLDSCGTCG